ncbi:MAG: AAA family ATPase [Flavobacteriales bacterium]|nr:AAA family ATPase [Flavobacteriales bacterium]
MNQPLAERLRPQTLDDFLGQDHLVGKSGPIRLALKSNLLPSMIFWGPPGVGKTTLAHIICKQLDRPFYTLSAINSGVKDVRDVINKAESNGLFNGGKSPVLFIDEIDRFSKSQQDSLLGAVEKGTITLIGATTENPSFEVISALLSRSQVYVLNHHSNFELEELLTKAIDNDVLLSQKTIILNETDALIKLSGGDARKLLNNFELVVNSIGGEKIEISNDIVQQHVQKNLAIYDKAGENHYDIASAFIKSIRGSDPNAALYYLARMIEGGEDAKFIARRLVISASEDIGMANPTALVMANACFDAVKNIGYPECRIALSQCTIYLTTSPKSNSAYEAIKNAQKIVKETGDLPIPLHLRNAPTQLMENMGYGKGYQYSHSGTDNFIDQEFFPAELSGTKLYDPGVNKKETLIKEWLTKLWKGKY